MGRPAKTSAAAPLSAPQASTRARQSADSGAIEVVSRAFDLMRCFEGPDHRLSNADIATRCQLPRSTVSRLTRALVTIGQLAYFPDEQRYGVGARAIAGAATLVRSVGHDATIRSLIERISRQIAGTIGLTCPDEPAMVYLECARAYDAVGLNSRVGSRVSIARTAAGQAYAAALAPAMFEALAARIEKRDHTEAALLRKRVAANRKMLAAQGYVVSQSLWHPQIIGLSVPFWSQRRASLLCLTSGVILGVYDHERLTREAGPILLEQAAIIARLEDAPDQSTQRHHGLPQHAEKQPLEPKQNIRQGGKR